MKTLRLHVIVVEPSQYMFNHNKYISGMNAIVAKQCLCPDCVTKKILKLDCSSGHRLIWWGGCDIDLQLTQCFTGTYCVNQSLSHTYIYEETSLSLV